MLNSADKVFRELRDLSFAAVGPRLGERAKAIQADYKDSKVRWDPELHQKLKIQRARPFESDESWRDYLAGYTAVCCWLHVTSLS